MNLAYYIFLLLIIFLLSLLLRKNIRLSPKKIKVYMSIVIFLFVMRYITLFTLCVVKNARFIHYLKGILYLNQFAIPLMVLALAYVYLRWDKLNFYVNYIIAIILGILYSVEIYFMKVKIMFSPNYGYIINIKQETIFYLATLVMVGVLLIFCMYFFDKPNNNRWGMTYLIIALVMVITENVLYIGGMKLFPYPIFGDAVFITLINLAVNTFKKKE